VDRNSIHRSSEGSLTIPLLGLLVLELSERLALSLVPSIGTEVGWVALVLRATPDTISLAAPYYSIATIFALTAPTRILKIFCYYESAARMEARYDSRGRLRSVTQKVPYWVLLVFMCILPNGAVAVALGIAGRRRRPVLAAILCGVTVSTILYTWFGAAIFEAFGGSVQAWINGNRFALTIVLSAVAVTSATFWLARFSPDPVWAPTPSRATGSDVPWIGSLLANRHHRGLGVWRLRRMISVLLIPHYHLGGSVLGLRPLCADRYWRRRWRNFRELWTPSASTTLGELPGALEACYEWEFLGWTAPTALDSAHPFAALVLARHCLEIADTAGATVTLRVAADRHDLVRAYSRQGFAIQRCEPNRSVVVMTRRKPPMNLPEGIS
jgi:hypothetical protein